jgi:mRNA interferase RelE/StbE
VRYEVRFSPHANREFKKLPKSVKEEIDLVIKSLAEDPRLYGYRKLHRWEYKYRVRVGDYRVIYEIHDGVLLVLVVSVGDRADIYRRFKSS